MGKTFDGEDEVVEKENEVVEENGTEKEKSAQDNQVEAIKESDSTKEVGEKAKAKEDKEPLFFVDADGKTKNVYGQAAFEKATAEKLEILKKRRSKRIRTLVITVGILSLVGVAGTMAYLHNKTKEAVSTETIEETTTEEDLNVPVGSQGSEMEAGDLKDILGSEPIVDTPDIVKSDPTESASASTEGQETKAEETTSIPQTTQGAIESKETQATKPNESKENQAQVQTQPQTTFETLSSEEIQKQVEDAKAAQVETEQSKEVETLQDKYRQDAMKDIADPEYQKYMESVAQDWAQDGYQDAK